MDQGHQGHRPLYCAVSTFVQQTQTLGTSKKSVIGIRRGGGGVDQSLMYSNIMGYTVLHIFDRFFDFCFKSTF